jgi:hypothetical protein
LRKIIFEQIGYMGTICIKLEKKFLEQKKDGYPFANNFKKKYHDKSNQWV